jgi:succinyl-CoA synthetase beta subunit
VRLFEFQGKKLFKEYGIPVPQSSLITKANVDEVCNMSFPIVLKAQALIGGRGKAGGIVTINKKEDMSENLKDLFGLEINGEAVVGVLAEEEKNIQHEYYLAITYQGDIAMPVLIASSAGGVDIEQVADQTPEKIIRVPFNPLIGPHDYQSLYIAKSIGLKDGSALKSIINKAYAIMRDYDAKLVEINPLVLTPEGLCALDAKISLDDKAAFRQEKRFQKIVKELECLEPSYRGYETSEKSTITYVPLNGAVGLISDGAGTGMLTLDLIKDAGAEAANFCEMGGITNPQVMYEAMEKVVSNPKVKSLLIILIGGFNRMDEMATGIIKFIRNNNMSIPMVVRMCGTMEEIGVKMMEEVNIATYDNLDEAVLKAVSLAGGSN